MVFLLKFSYFCNSGYKVQQKKKKIIHNQECVYIYIYMGLVQVLLGETLNNVTPINIFNWM